MDVLNVLRLRESKGPTGAITDNGAAKELGSRTKVFDVKVSGESGLIVKDEGTSAADKNKVVDVDI
jgi:hypothetical protein